MQTRGNLQASTWIEHTRRDTPMGPQDEAGEQPRRPAHPLVMSSCTCGAAKLGLPYQPPMRSSMTGTVRAMMRMSSASDCRRM